MDSLVETFAASFNVGQSPNSTYMPHPRFAEYKPKHSNSSQIERRLQLLQEQKKKRRNVVDEFRHLSVEAFQLATANKKKNEAFYRDRLMHSEWLVDIPVDLTSLWVMVPSPEGRRALVVAKNGITECYTKQGHRLFAFPSLLPGGNNLELRLKFLTMLDCIYNNVTNEFYVLDLLAWGNQPMLDCDANFRFYWLETQFRDTPSLSVKSQFNRYPFRLLQRSKCIPASVTELLRLYPFFSSNMPKIDGLLFYHKEAHYTSGTTPLVGWLKPYMMPEVLGIPVADEYMDGISPYLSLTQQIQDEEKKSKERKNSAAKKGKKNTQPKKKKKKGTVKMEVSGPEDSSTDVRADDSVDAIQMDSSDTVQSSEVTQSSVASGAVSDAVGSTSNADIDSLIALVVESSGAVAVEPSEISASFALDYKD